LLHSASGVYLSQVTADKPLNTEFDLQEYTGFPTPSGHKKHADKHFAALFLAVI